MQYNKTNENNFYFLTKEQIQVGKEFAQKISINNFEKYSEKRNQSNLSIIESQFRNGIFAEIGVSKLLKNCSKPNTRIFDFSKSKSQDYFSCDLTDGKNSFHVKSCNIDSKFPISWLFQKIDPLVYNPTESDFIVLTIVENISNINVFDTIENQKENDEKVKITIKSIIHAKDAIEHKCYQEPKKESLKKGKTCLYWDNVKNLSNKMENFLQ